MNWTGGSLQRSKKANKGVLQRQKQHFARVRTQLQNGQNRKASTSPFHPSFFDGGQLRLGERLPPLHLPRPPEAQVSGLSSQQPSGVQGVLKDQAGHRAAHTAIDDGQCELPKSTRGEKPKRKQKPNAVDHEGQSFDAKRMKLLNQDDWIGLGPSRPVKMDLNPNHEREKGRIGKRRRAQGRQQRNNDAPQRSHHRAFRDSHSPFVIQNDTDDIRIRIGTDAWANATLTQQTHHAPSQRAPESAGPSSDIMLLDHDHLSTPASMKPIGVSQGASVSVEALAHQSDSNHSVAKPRARFSEKHEVSDFDTIRDILIGKHVSSGDHLRNEAINTQRSSAQSIKVPRPLRLDIESAYTGAHVAAQGSTIGETNHGREPANAGLFKSGYGTGNEHGHWNAERTPARLPLIVDDGPWKWFIAHSDSSSTHSNAEGRPRTGSLHLYESPFERQLSDAGLTIGSRQATLGDRTRISSPACSSAVLPSIRRRGQNGMLNDGPGVKSSEKPVCYSEQTRSLEANERLWQQYVFEAAEEDCSVTCHISDMDDETLTNYVEYRPAEVAARPCCTAVESVSSTPFRSVSGLISSVSDNIQNAAARAPLSTRSGSMLLARGPPRSPPHAGGFNEAFGDEHAADNEWRTVENSGFGEGSVTQASIRNNVSCDVDATPPSRIFGDSRAPRGLDVRPSSSRNEHRVGPAVAKRSERHLVRRHIYDIEEDEDDDDDDDDGILLVDADRL